MNVKHEKALEQLMEAYACSPSLGAACDIMDFRIRNYASGLAAGECAPILPAAKLQPPVWLPEIDAGELAVDVLREHVANAGGLIVRGLITEPEAQAYREKVHAAFEERQRIEEGSINVASTSWLQRPSSIAGIPVGRNHAKRQKGMAIGSMWAVDAPTIALDLIGTFQTLGLDDLLAAYFHDGPVLSVKKWVLRRVKPNNGAEAGWHQDGRFMGEGIRSLNLWLSLSACGSGSEAPGIEFLVDNKREIYETGTQGAHFDWTVGQQLVESLATAGVGAIVRPYFGPGDAVFFDHYSLHRTAFGLSDCDHRYAVESWFFPRSNAPQNQHPLVF